MAKKILIRKGLNYKLKNTSEIFTLQEDYNGSWYLDRRDEKGYTKTFSQSKHGMLLILEKYYERV